MNVAQVVFKVVNKAVCKPSSRSIVNFKVFEFSTSKIKFIGYPPLAIMHDPVEGSF